jgi:gamma-glutamylaminecyclotransferase
MQRVFAFGTLKRGFPLHARGLPDARYLGDCKTVERPRRGSVVRSDDVFDEPGTGLQVRGELFEVADERLAKLDVLESVGKPGNFRKRVAVEMLDGSGRCEAFAFMKSRELASPLHSGLLAIYDDARFILPESR